MKLHTQTLAKRVALRIANRNNLAASAAGDSTVTPSPAGLIPESLIVQVVTSLVSLIIKCFRPDDGAQAQAYLSARYKDGKYKDSVQTASARRAKQAAEQNGGLLAYRVAEELAIQSLDEARTMDPQELSVVIRENS